MAEASSSKSKKGQKRKQTVLVPSVPTRALSDYEKSVSFDKTASEMANNKFRTVFRHCSVHLERGLDFNEIHPTLRTMFTTIGWLGVTNARTELINTTVVAEFFSVLATYEGDFDAIVSIPLRGVNVPFLAASLKRFYGIPEVPNSEDYYTVWNLSDPAALERRALQAQHAFDPEAVWFENRFGYGGCLKPLRAFKRFLATSVYPSANETSFGKQDVCITWAMVNKIRVDLRKVMFRRAIEYALTAKKKGHLPFPSLITALCSRARVPVLPADVFASPTMTLIGQRLPSDPDGPIDIYTLEPPPPTTSSSTSSSQPSSSSAQFPPQPGYIQSFQVEALFHYLLAELARTDANNAISCERQRFWAEDLRRGLTGHVASMIESDSAYALVAASHPQCQPIPYTLPAWLPPIPPPVIFQPYPSSSIGHGGFSAGTSMSFSAAGGVTSMADLTMGMTTMSLDSSVRMTTSTVPDSSAAFTFPVSDASQYSQDIFTSQTGGFLSSSPFAAAMVPYIPASTFDDTVVLDDDEE